MLVEQLQKLMHGGDLSQAECVAALEAILTTASPEQAAAFLVLLHTKGETPAEILGFVTAMRAKMNAVDLPYPAIDIVGTGGDNANTVNISTMAALVVASCGVKVAKHGNRSVSSKCGSADILEQLGVKIDLSGDQVKACIDAVNIGFFYAQKFHPAMKKIAVIRKALGVRTTFNILGPLLNPAKVQYYLAGVYSARYLHLYADVLQQLGVKRAMVVNGCGLDELSCLGPTNVIDVTEDSKRGLVIDPKDYGFQYCDLKALQGGDPELNQQRLLAVFQGEKGPIADTVSLNAGVALAIIGHVNSIHEGVDLAQQKIKGGFALQQLQQFITVSQQELL